MFYKCTELSSLPDISQWDTSKVNNMSQIFSNYTKLSSLPYISKWNISNVNNKNDMFKDCKTDLNIPSKFKN